MALKEQDVVLYSTDADGNKVIQMPITRIENVEGAIKTINGVGADDTGNYPLTIVDSTKIPISGARGNLAGYESSGTATTINATARDANQTSSSITVSNGTSSTAWTKIVRITSSSATVTLGSSWKWQGGSAPTIVSGGILVCCWCGSGGIATFISPS